MWRIFLNWPVNFNLLWNVHIFWYNPSLCSGSLPVVLRYELPQNHKNYGGHVRMSGFAIKSFCSCQWCLNPVQQDVLAKESFKTLWLVQPTPRLRRTAFALC